MGDRMVIAAKIEDALTAQGITQKEFAMRMGKTQSEVSDWLSGKRNFTLDTLSDIGVELHVHLLDLSQNGYTNINKRGIEAVLSVGKRKSTAAYNTFTITDCLFTNKRN